ncbi:MAG: hypothetical protein EPN97_16950 [Alphaproteobacteria bacterium]|nr:MAG: hypothetical protein EPN97_16950 [Alphaproteobacteria bacterium]
MKTYLWYSLAQERKAVENDERPKPGLRGSFSRPPAKGFCVYLDAVGEPVKVSQVSHSPEHGTAFSDMRLLDAVDETRILVDNRGNLMPDGEEFCAAKGIEPGYFPLMQYMHKLNTTATFLRRDLPVKKPLRLKA